MMDNTGKKRFLLGRGEKLTEKIAYKGGFGSSSAPYTFTEQKQRLVKQLQAQTQQMNLVPQQACPNGNNVSTFTLSPQYISRSSFPEALFKRFDFRLIGSRPVKIKPEKGRGSDRDEGVASSSLFVAATSSAFEAFANTLETLDENDDETIIEDILKLETIDFFTPDARLQGRIPKKQADLEVVVHFDSTLDADWEASLYQFASEAGIDLDASHAYQSRGLLFLPGLGNAASAKQLAQFSFIRAIRPMPKLRIIDRPSILRSSVHLTTHLPSEPPVDPTCRVAIFDGGLRENHPFGLWAEAIEPPASYSIGDPIDEYLDHGTAVTSAALFGPVTEGTLPRPYAAVDHYRVLGTQVADKHLYNVMLYVDEVLSQSNYPLATFSFGPHEVAGDDQVTAWTSMLDDHFGEGTTLATIAVGNDGQAQWPHSRIQVPSDCVNALAIGASDSTDNNWQRAPYSSIGPGRHPGLIKPDVVFFGGTDDQQFRFIFPGPSVAEGCGTSYATPAAMRIASGLKSYFGSDLSAQAIRALLIHSADPAHHHRDEVGWGLIPDDIESIVSCEDGTVRVAYQGKLEPGKVLRAPIPVPEEQLAGNVVITATFCYGCLTDPHTPGDYTRAGLDVTFRPHKGKFTKDPDYPDTDPFFKRHEKSNEQELRLDAHKWDTVLHNTKRKNGASLLNPTFDIHYLAREPGNKSSPTQARKLPYALIITVCSKRTPDIYERVENRYRNRLSAMQPRIDLPVMVRT